jgi:hypothetical protein
MTTSKVLPFWRGTWHRQVGYRRYHCAKFVWDQTDREFALSFAAAERYVLHSRC